MRVSTRTALAAIAASAAASAALAGAIDLDIGLAVVNGRMVTGAVPEGATLDDVIASPARAWESEFETGGTAAEPGFYGPAGLFQPGTAFGYNVIGPLRRWTGGDFVDSLERMVLTFPGQADVVVPEPGADPATVVPGHTFSAGADGGFDDHPFFNVLQNDFTPGAAPGAYLLKLEFRSGGLQNSEPIWVLFNNEVAPAEFEVAFDYVQDIIVPAPGTAAAMLCIGGLAGLGRRRR